MNASATSFLNCSSLQSNSSNITSNPHSPRLLDLLLSCLTMIFGTVSNLTALGILAMSRGRFRGQSKAPFLLLTVALLLADLGGHFILGAFALYGHISARYDIPSIKSSVPFCNTFGASMVFFGLCPLLLGCAMAVERWVAINKPFLHVYITMTLVKREVLLLTSSALLLALLPVFTVGKYATQYPGTWCFLPIQGSQTTADRSLVLVFSCLGLTALILSLLCNILSGLPLLKAKLESGNCYTGGTNPSARSSRKTSSTSTSSSTFCSLEVEMLVQLAGVTVVSCVCWGPFLVCTTFFNLHNLFKSISILIYICFELLDLQL